MKRFITLFISLLLAMAVCVQLNLLTFNNEVKATETTPAAAATESDSSSSAEASPIASQDVAAETTQPAAATESDSSSSATKPPSYATGNAFEVGDKDENNMDSAGGVFMMIFVALCLFFVIEAIVHFIFASRKKRDARNEEKNRE